MSVYIISIIIIVVTFYVPVQEFLSISVSSSFSLSYPRSLNPRDGDGGGGVYGGETIHGDGKF